MNNDIGIIDEMVATLFEAWLLFNDYGAYCLPVINYGLMNGT